MVSVGHVWVDQLPQCTACNEAGYPAVAAKLITRNKAKKTVKRTKRLLKQSKQKEATQKKAKKKRKADSLQSISESDEPEPAVKKGRSASVSGETTISSGDEGSGGNGDDWGARVQPSQVASSSRELEILQAFRYLPACMRSVWHEPQCRCFLQLSNRSLSVSQKKKRKKSDLDFAQSVNIQQYCPHSPEHTALV